MTSPETSNHPPEKIKPSFTRAAFVGLFLVLSTAQTKAAFIAYEGFDHTPPGTTTGLNGDTGWTGAWAAFSTVSGMALSGTDQSLAFNQAPPDGLITDGSAHVCS